MPNLGEIAQNAAKILRFFTFSRWRPSAILDLQKLEISTLHVKLENAYSRPKVAFTTPYKP